MWTYFEIKDCESQRTGIVWWVLIAVEVGLWCDFVKIFGMHLAMAWVELWV